MDTNVNNSKTIRRFFWNGHTYLLRKIKNTQEIELIMFLGQIHDVFTKIEKSIKNKEYILNFLIMRNIPMIEYLAIEKVFIDET